MREIKFRAWDKEEKKWKEELGTVIMLNGTVLDKYDLEVKNLILMQYTGLKDKNGKEIYEGDILKFNDHENKYYNGYFWVVEWDKARWRFSARPSSEVQPGVMFNNHPENLEIIGNIYENPELLNINGSHPTAE